MTKKLKVLVSAYACSPYKGSEPGVGWGYIRELAKDHELWVIVEEEKFRDDVERFLAKNPSVAERIHFYFLKKRRNRRLRKLWPPSYYWYYRQWHWHAFKLAQSLHKQVSFDVAHQLTMVGFREPGYLWRLRIPFVWGPVGGMGFFPWRFLTSIGTKGAFYYLAYNILNWWQMNFSARPRLAARAAGAGLVVATPENKTGAFRHWGNNQATLMSEVGVPLVQAREPMLRKSQEPLQIIWSGLHTPRKALNLGLQALAKLPEFSDWELHVLGDGDRSDDWRRLVKTLGVAGRVRFHGWLPRDDAMRIMHQSHVMLITSLRDLTSTVIIEALALGLPVICLDHCGFANVIDDSCGFKIPVLSPAETISSLAHAIEKIEADESLRRHLAKGAILRAKQFSWDNKRAVMNEVYEKVLVDKKDNRH